MKKMTYKDAGVDIEKEEKAIKMLMKGMKVNEKCKIKYLCPSLQCETCKPMDKYEFETEMYMIVDTARAFRNSKQPHLYMSGKTQGMLCERCNNDDWLVWCSCEPPKNWHWADSWKLVKVKVTGIIDIPKDEK